MGLLQVIGIEPGQGRRESGEQAFVAFDFGQRRPVDPGQLAQLPLEQGLGQRIEDVAVGLAKHPADGHARPVVAHVAGQQVAQGVEAIEPEQVQHRNVDQVDQLPLDPTLQDQQRQPLPHAVTLDPIDLIDTQHIGFAQGFAVHPLRPQLLRLLIPQPQQPPCLRRRQRRVLPRREQARAQLTAHGVPAAVGNPVRDPPVPVVHPALGKRCEHVGRQGIEHQLDVIHADGCGHRLEHLRPRLAQHVVMAGRVVQRLVAHATLDQRIAQGDQLRIGRAGRRCGLHPDPGVTDQQTGTDTFIIDPGLEHGLGHQGQARALGKHPG